MRAATKPRWAARVRGTEIAGHVADVTVIVAVYNTMPYLTRCLTSLVRQSIGLDRLEIIAVDDGSTDGSGAELDRFARRYPDTFTVIHQANSGGPAAPSNRGLRHATGRYVFFVGADDYLGGEALERLVAAADQHGSDVVAGRMVGINGRFVPTAVFERTDYDVDLYDSHLPFAMSNTKLFRRSVIAEHGIQFPESLPFGSDQPFTAAVCVRAKKISVLADYDYYFAVRRGNSGNITYRSTPLNRLGCTELIMAESTARLLEPGRQRDAIMLRSFSSELSKLTRAEFLDVEPHIQRQVCDGIGRLVDRYMTDEIASRLDVGRRVRLRLAQRGCLDELVGVVRQNAGLDEIPLIAEGERLYAGYRGFRDPRLGLPDEWFLIANTPIESVARQLTLTKIGWYRRRGTLGLVITAVSPLDASAITDADLRISVGFTPAKTTIRPDGPSTILTARLPLRSLATHRPVWTDTREVRVDAGTAEVACSVPVRMPARLAATLRPTMVGRRIYLVRPRRHADGDMVVDIIPLTWRRIIQRLRQKMVRR